MPRLRGQGETHSHVKFRVLKPTLREGSLQMVNDVFAFSLGGARISGHHHYRARPGRYGQPSSHSRVRLKRPGLMAWASAFWRFCRSSRRLTVTTPLGHVIWVDIGLDEIGEDLQRASAGDRPSRFSRRGRWRCARRPSPPCGDVPRRFTEARRGASSVTRQTRHTRRARSPPAIKGPLCPLYAFLCSTSG